MALDEYGMDDEATCGVCNHKLTIVRPGKYACPWCEQYGELVEIMSAWQCNHDLVIGTYINPTYDLLPEELKDFYRPKARQMIDKITDYLKIDELNRVFDCANNVVWDANEDNTSGALACEIEELKEAIEAWRAKSVR
jgi:hypothetical protein